jgi:hypothetical protein
MSDFKPPLCHKRKRLEDRFKDGVRSPPKIVSQIVPTHGANMVFSVPSTQRQSMISRYEPINDRQTDDVPMRIAHYKPTHHKVTFGTVFDTASMSDSAKLSYACTCGKDTETFGVCRHMTAAALYIVIDLLNKQEKTEDMTARTDDLMTALQNLCIDEESYDSMIS